MTAAPRKPKRPKPHKPQAPELPLLMTIGEKYGPAIRIIGQAEADRYFKKLVWHTMAAGGNRDEAERIERSNLGYYAGYYTDETRERVERLFRCEHPVFGSIAKNGPPSVLEALAAAMLMGLKRQ